MSVFFVEFFNGNDEEWDNFVLEKSRNGTFIQTRRFINYHNVDKFIDSSICVRKGTELVATILACVINEDGKTLFAHKGTTFGGITISDSVYSTSALDEMFAELELFIRENRFDRVYLKMVPQVYQRRNCDLLDYFLYKHEYREYSELNYYMHLERYSDDVVSQFSSSKRRDFRYSLKNSLSFKELSCKEEIQEYYAILKKNLVKLNLPAVHSLSDLIDLKMNRFDSKIAFFGVFFEQKMIAGSMVFFFENGTMHTQYLSSDEDYLKLFPMDFLIKNLLDEAIRRGYKQFSFGICTEKQGRYLNLGLSRFKEGFGTEFCINYSYEKIF